MKTPLRRREETVSATIPATLWLIAGFSLILVLGASASQPGWWTTSGAVTDTNNSTTNNSIAVNMGQVKQFTARAVGEMNSNLPGGAGPALSNMVYSWQTNYATNGWNGTNPKPSDLQAANVGQLKYIGQQVWSQLVSAGYTNALPSWLAQTNAGDYAVANIGQLKTVFNFNLSLLGPTNLTASANTNGTINLSWTPPANNQATSYLIEQQSLTGAWSIIHTITNPSITNYAVSNLAAGENPSFEIIAQDGTHQSSAQTTAGDPALLAPSNVHGVIGVAPGEIDITWQNNSTDATYILINESTDGVNWHSIANISPASTSYAATNLTVGQAYYFGVSAGNN